MTSMDEAACAQVRGAKVAMIFQEPMIALDPVFTIGEQIAETIVRHEGVSYHVANRRALELLEWCKFPPRRDASKPIRTSVGRHAAAGDDCPRPVVPVLAPAGRRADHGARRHGANQIILLLRQLQQELGWQSSS